MAVPIPNEFTVQEMHDGGIDALGPSGIDAGKVLSVVSAILFIGSEICRRLEEINQTLIDMPGPPD